MRTLCGRYAQYRLNISSAKLLNNEYNAQDNTTPEIVQCLKLKLCKNLRGVWLHKLTSS